MTTGSVDRVIQLHPSRWCNLRCRHCYSSSGPSARASLPPELLEQATRDAAAEGYTRLSVSGGEPLMYDGLTRVLDAARGSGMKTSLVTNGTLLTPGRVKDLRSRLDLLAISIDGRKERHDRMRGTPGAFERMTERLPEVRSSGVPFGFVFTLSRESFDELLACIELAVEQQARFFQIHLLDETGRARDTLAGQSVTREETLRAWLAAQHLAKAFEGRIVVTIDAVPTRTIPDLVPEVFTDTEREPRRLADALSPLVVEDDGALVPLEYGIHRRHALGSLRAARLPALARTWLADERGFRALASLCRGVYAKARADEVPVTTWYQEVLRETLRPTISRLGSGRDAVTLSSTNHRP
jgi:Fe-coproporphyrin III synthase